MTELFDLNETKYLEDGLWLSTTDREGSQRMNILSFVLYILENASVVLIVSELRSVSSASSVSLYNDHYRDNLLTWPYKVNKEML